jgi:hypothetical protein
MKNQNNKKTVTLNEDFYLKLKQYCQEKGLKISWLVENVLLNYIKNEKNEK